MTRTLFISLPVADLAVSTAFYQALGFERNAQFSDDASACMRWSEAIQVMLLTREKWRTFTQRPLPPAGTCGQMLSLSLDSREAVDAMNRAAAAHGGQADANPPEDYGFMYSRDLADPDGHLLGAVWMDPAPMNVATGILKEFFAAINRNDVLAATRHFDPQVVRVEPEGFPTSGTWHGIAQAREHLARGRGTWAEGSCEPEQFLVQGDKVVVYLHVRVRLKGATDWIDARFADGFVFHDGRITEHRSFGERADALAWAGIADRAQAG